MESKSKNLIIGIAAGSAVGGILGLLYAPDKGKETRKKIKEQAHDITDQVKLAKQELAKTIEAKKTDFEDKTEEIISKLSYKAEDIISKMEQKLEALKKKNAVLHK